MEAAAVIGQIHLRTKKLNHQTVHHESLILESLEETREQESSGLILNGSGSGSGLEYWWVGGGVMLKVVGAAHQ